MSLKLGLGDFLIIGLAFQFAGHVNVGFALVTIGFLVYGVRVLMAHLAWRKAAKDMEDEAD